MALDPPIEQVLTHLAETPERLKAITGAATDAQLHAAPAPGAWSANDILAHLRACADVFGDCIATILAEDHPTIKAINPRTWIDRTNYPQLKFRNSLRAFARQRTALLATLRPLPPAAWERAALVVGAGRPLTRTVHFYAEWLRHHERTHFKPLARLLPAR